MGGGPYASMFITNWFLELFSGTLPYPLMIRVWDLYFVKGTPILYGAGLALLEHLEPLILAQSDFGGIVTTIRKAQDTDFDYPEFLTRILRYGVKDHHIE